MLRLFLAVLAAVLAGGEHRSAMAKPTTLLDSLAGPKSYVPAPSRYTLLTSLIDPNVNRDGQMVGAYADPANATIHVPKGQADPFVVGHELGHLFDSQMLSDGDRHYFARIMHAPSGAWDLGETTGKVDGNVSPNEWFSDFYGASVAGTDFNHGGISSFATITPRRLHNFQAALTRLGKRRGLPGVNVLDLLTSAQ